MSSENKRIKAVFLTRVALSTALMAVSSMICIPFPVPITLQVFVLYFVLFTFGGSTGLLASLLYILIGAAGVPVFSGLGSGIGRLLEPSGGFIIGFAVSAAVYFLLQKFFLGKLARITAVMVSFLALYICGIIHIALLYGSKSSDVLSVLSLFYLIPYLIPDALKLIFAHLFSKKIKKYI